MFTSRISSAVRSASMAVGRLPCPPMPELSGGTGVHCEYVQRDQPPGVPPLELTGERTLPDVPDENYWFRRHLVVYEWIASRVRGLRVIDMACGEGYGADALAAHGSSVVGVDANPEASVHPRLRLTRRFYGWLVPAIMQRDFMLRDAPQSQLDDALDFVAVCRP